MRPFGRDRNRSPVAELDGHTGSVFAVAIAPDGNWLATGGADNTVRIWDLATGNERVVIARRDENLAGDSGKKAL